MFKSAQDVALQLSLDGFQLVNMKTHETTPVIILNLNLPPDIRYRQENILTSFIIPGPRKHRDLDSFLLPLVEELEGLDHGVDAFDAYNNDSFSLYAWVLFVTGDGPALADITGLKSPGNAKLPCRQCPIVATGYKGPEKASKTTYYVVRSHHADGSIVRHPRRENTVTRQLIELLTEVGDKPLSAMVGKNSAHVVGAITYFYPYYCLG